MSNSKEAEEAGIEVISGATTFKPEATMEIKNSKNGSIILTEEDLKIVPI